MKRRDLIKSLALLPITPNIFTIEPKSLPSSFTEKEFASPLSNSSLSQEFSVSSSPFVMDGHIHLMSRQLLQNLDIGQRYQDGMIDLPRAKEGGLNAMFFSVFTPEPYYPGHYEVKNTFRVIELALDQISKNRDLIELAHTASEIMEVKGRGKIAAFLDVEGSFDLDGDLNLLRMLYRLGVRSLQLTAHNQTNGFIDSCYGTRLWGGLNDHGHKVIEEMNRLGMVINVAHASDESILQVASISRQPIAYTHGGFRSIVNNLRCITDEAAKAIAAKDGVIGIQFGNSFNNPKYVEWEKSQHGEPKAGVASKNSPNLSIADVDRQVAAGLPFVSHEIIPEEYRMSVDQLVKVVDYGVRLVGEDHIALGSDFDGGLALPKEMKDVSDYPKMIQALQNFGYSEQRISKIIGLNWLRLIRNVTETR
jgi:membrane dipeptidase